jgi:hypothetical protein
MVTVPLDLTYFVLMYNFILCVLSGFKYNLKKWRSVVVVLGVINSIAEI